MKISPSRITLTVLLAGGLTAAHAQVTATAGSGTAPSPSVLNAAQTTGLASASLNISGNPAGTLGAAQLGIRSGTAGSTIPASAETLTNMVTGVETIATAGGSESNGMRRDRLNNAASVGAAAFAATPAATAIDPAAVAGNIRRSSFDDRAELGRDLDRDLATGERVMTDARTAASSLDRDARAEFTAAAADVSNARQQLEQSRNAAASATSATWPEAREQLASDYQAYFQAVARAQQIAGSAAASGRLD